MFKAAITFASLLIGFATFAQSRLINIIPINSKVYVHESFLQTQEWGKVSCNGMVYVNKGEAIIFDTPSTLDATNELIKIVKDSLKARIVGVVVNHFHDDCLAGLKIFHQLKIKSYASSKTVAMAKESNREVPQIGFNQQLSIKCGEAKVENYYLGAAHTQDNIVSYIPSERVLFGGCMVKAMGSNKGNLADADTTKWSNTIHKVKKLNPEIVIPGHGKFGGPELLDYTEYLFKN